MRPAAAFLVVALAVGIAACGGDGEVGGGKAGDALAYLPADAGTVILVSTDLESESMRALDRSIFSAVAGDSIESVLRQLARGLGLRYEQDIEPLLGNDFVLGSLSEQGFFAAAADEDPGAVAALDTDDGEKLRDVVGRVRGVSEAGEASGAQLYEAPGEGGVTFAVEDDVIVFAENRDVLERALALRDGDDRLTADRVEEELAGLPADAPIRAVGSLRGAMELPELARFRGVPWFDALRSFAVAVSASENELRADFALVTEPDGLEEDDLPLVTGDETPEVLERATEITASNRDQSQTTVFLLRAMREAYPDARFVRGVEAVERELGIDFEDEVLRQFDGPSASAVSPDGQRFAARSTVRDPEALRAALPRLAPHLPALIEGLQGLQSEGMALLFLFAPDAPAATALEQVQVEPPSTPDGLYHVTGLTGEGPSELYFGLVGDVFVVASDEQSARRIADEPTVAVEGVEGAGVARADVGALIAEAQDQFGILPPRFGELFASLEASTERLRGRVRVELR